MLDASQNNTQIAAPQRATTKQTKASKHVSRHDRLLPDDVGSAAEYGSDGAHALPKQPHPVLLMRANDLVSRARECAPVKTTAHFFTLSALRYLS
jgi:hypothetical protein